MYTLVLQWKLSCDNVARHDESFRNLQTFVLLVLVLMQIYNQTKQVRTAGFVEYYSFECVHWQTPPFIGAAAFGSVCSSLTIIVQYSTVA